MTRRWHILTPELPPDCGGVGDYTAQVAVGLSKSGDRVTVYSPPQSARWQAADGIEVVTLDDCFGPRSEAELTTHLDRDPSSRLLIQYVPSVFGRGAANVPFCRWLRSRARAGSDLRVMFHEPYSYLGWRPDHLLKAFAQRSMARMLLDGASAVYLSTDTWRRYLSDYGPESIARAVTLPIPSSIPRVDCCEAVGATRAAGIGDATFLLGHFGTYGAHVAPLLRRAIGDLLSSDPQVAIMCAGAGSDSFAARILAENPAFRGRITGTGRASAHDISVRLQACDLLVQPYPDGVTTRRTSVMAAVANGRAVVTSDGPLTEPVWRETGCVSLTQSTAGLVNAARDLLADASGRASLQLRAAATYASTFDLRHTLDALQAPADG
jgi:glycosyltransferase involved in cell wall biosynthesis